MISPGSGVCALVGLGLASYPLPRSSEPIAERPSSRAAFARVELSGPLTEAVFDAGSWGRTVVRAQLVSGERLELVLPIPGPDGPPSVHLDRPEVSQPDPPGGSARFVDWLADVDPPLTNSSPARSPGSGSRAGVGGRPRAALSAARVRPGWSERMALLAVCVLILAFRRRPGVALALAGLGAFGMLTLRRSADVSARLTVFELGSGADLALRIDSAKGALSLAPRVPLALEVEPAGRALEFLVAIEQGRWASWRVRALEPSGARAVTLRVLNEIQSPRFRPPSGAGAGLNQLATLGPCFWRDAAGAWARLEGWPRAAQEPTPPAGGAESGLPQAPPGWLNPALPLGKTVFVARVVNPAELPPRMGPAGPGLAPTEAWIRWLGPP